MSPTAIFRADASAEIGTGHVQRCLTLARTLAGHGWRAGFAVGAETALAVPALAETGFMTKVCEGTEERELDGMRKAWPEGADLLFVDHYGRGEAFERSTRGWARRVAAMDDVPSRKHDVDLLVDPTLGHTAADYDDLVPAQTIVLAGGDYIMLRPEVLRAGGGKRPTPGRATRVLVGFGGSDPDNLTARAIDALADARLAGISATVIVGPGHAHADDLLARQSDGIRVVVNPPELPELMASADMALAGSGTMAWELAFLGVPALLAVNSKGDVAAALMEAGAALSLGEAGGVTAAMMADALNALAGDRKARAAMSDAGRRAVDGRGAERVAAAIEALAA